MGGTCQVYRAAGHPCSLASRPPAGAENLCHQAIIAGDATHAVMPPDPEMLTAALLLLAAGRVLRQAAGNQRAGGESRADMRSSAVGTSQ